MKFLLPRRKENNSHFDIGNHRPQSALGSLRTSSEEKGVVPAFNVPEGLMQDKMGCRIVGLTQSHYWRIETKNRVLDHL